MSSFFAQLFFQRLFFEAARPLTTDDAYTVKEGEFQVEAGFDFTRQDIHDKEYFPSLTLTYGLFERMDIGIGRIYLSAAELDYLAELPGRTLPQTMDFLEMVKAIGKTYAELMSRISEERPEILEKLVKVREQREADMDKRVRWGFPNVCPT